MKKSKKSNVIKHLEDDMKTFKHEANDDKKLIKDLTKKKPKKKKKC